MSPPAPDNAVNPALLPDHALQQAGLQNTAHRTEDFELAVLTGITLLRLHSLQPLEELNTALQEANIGLPGRVNQASGQDPAVLCLAPSDWLVFSEYLSRDQLLPVMQAAIDPGRTALLDQAAAWAVFRLQGPVAPWLLSKCSGLDWRQVQASSPHCCRTLLDRIPGVLHYHRPGSGSGPQVFDVLVERSLARQAWQMLLDRLPHARELFLQHGPL